MKSRLKVNNIFIADVIKGMINVDYVNGKIKLSYVSNKTNFDLLKNIELTITTEDVSFDNVVDWRVYIPWMNQYKYSNYVGEFRDTIILKDGLLSLGFAYLPGVGNNSAILVKTDFGGNILWAKMYSPFNYKQASPIQTSLIEVDGGYIIIGRNAILKIDNDGNILWAKEYNIDIIDSCLINNGDYFIMGGIWLNSVYEKLLITKIDNSGDILWGKSYGIDGYHFEAYDSIIDNGYIVLLGGSPGIIIKTDLLGNLEFSFKYGDYIWRHLANYEQGYVVFAESNPANESGKFVSTTLDKNGNLISSKTYELEGNEGMYLSRITDIGYGEYLILGYVQGIKQFPGVSQYGILIKTDLDTIQWSKLTPIFHGKAYKFGGNLLVSGGPSLLLGILNGEGDSPFNFDATNYMLVNDITSGIAISDMTTNTTVNDITTQLQATDIEGNITVTDITSQVEVIDLVGILF